MTDSKQRYATNPVLMTAAETTPLLDLDVRPLLEQDHDPLLEILQALEQLTADGLMMLSAPFRPDPLITLLENRGYRLNPIELDPHHWRVEILTAAAPDITDYRDLTTPETVEKILAQVTRLPLKGSFIARIPPLSTPLLSMLQEHHLDWSILEDTDGSAIIHVQRRPGPT